MSLRWKLRLVLTAVVVVPTLWAFYIEPSSLRVREYRLNLPRWPEQNRGLRVALLADLHVGSPMNGLDNLRRVVSETNSVHPDLILLAGDFVIHGVLGGHFVPPESMAAVLRDLKAPLGVYAVLGNHDWWFDGKRVASEFSKAGICMLEQQAKEVTDIRYRFWIVGVGDLWEGAHDVKAALDQVRDDDPVLLFTHNPDLFTEVPERVALTMAGHTHGGQVYLPLVGRLIVPSKYGDRFAIGHLVEDGRHLFVTPGIGTSMLPVRFLVPPEISVLVLDGSR